MKRFANIRNRCLWLLLYLTPVLLGGYYLGGKLLRQTLIEALNEQLQVKVRVHSVHFSGFQSFPHLGITLNNVRIGESQPAYNQTLLSAGRIVIDFNPLQLLRGKNEIDRIEFSNGIARLFINKDGKTNFEILKPGDPADDNPLDLDLKKIVLSNFTCLYQDKSEGHSADFHTQHLLFSGKFGKDIFKMKSKGDARFQHLKINDQVFARSKQSNFDIALEINNNTNTYKIEKGHLNFDQLKLNVMGSIRMVKDAPDLDLNFIGEHMDVQSILSLLPSHKRKALKDLQSNGLISLSGVIKGKIKDNNLPIIEANFDMKDVAIFMPDNALDIRSVQLKGLISNKNSSNNLQLNIELKELRTANTKIKGSFSVASIFQPELVYSSSGLVNMNDFEGLLKLNLQTLNKLYGKLQYNLNGTLLFDDNKAPDIGASKLFGDIDLKDLVFDDKDAGNIEHLYITSRINGDNLERINLKGNIFKNNVLFKGEVKRWQSYLTSKKRLMVKGELTSQDLNLSKMLNQDENSQSTEEVDLDLGVDLDLKINTGKFEWSSFKAMDLTGHLVWDHATLNLNRAKFKAWNGDVDCVMEIKPISEGYQLIAHATAKDVLIESLFVDFDNFGQSEFTPDIINGSISTTIDIRMLFDQQFNILEDSTLATADVSIKEGRLRNYKPMESLSTFVKLNDLMDIRFEELKNTLEIKNGVITIPNMKLYNNAMNVELGGSHSFDNYMDYKMKINVTEILAGKSGWAKRKVEQQLQDESNGGLSAYLHMSGTPDNLKIRYDVKSVKEVVGKEIKMERKRFIQDVKREIRGETIIDSVPKKKNRWDE